MTREEPRTELFTPVGSLLKQRPRSQKIGLGSSPGENAFVTQQLSTTEKWRLDLKFVPARMQEETS
jgi:hypothetical protein